MRFTRETYTVGWISALQKEQAATRLDEYHESPPLQKHDTTYVFGTIAGHHVVQACLPAMGTNAAARCATNLQGTFPNLRFILMVGIGGGVPSTQDIRLGDVVVSMPTKLSRGVCQYDFGTRLQGESLLIRDTVLSRPPDVLVTAVHALHSRYSRIAGRNPLGQALSSYADALTGIRRPTIDELYQPKYRHLDDRLSCEECECDEKELIVRPSRGRDIHPRVHQGLVASGNAVMRDALERDRLSRQMDVLCFEMEAGGVMTETGCIIIRGICDYCDSHKNKGWQDYAAAVAAGYAKELLSVVAPLQSSLKQQNDTTYLPSGILDWISDTRQAQQQSDLSRRREPNTGRWFQQSPEVKDWLEGESRTLVCPGAPGAGKTFIACSTIQYLRRPGEGNSSSNVCYFYCNYGLRDKQGIEHVLASLLRQSLENMSSITQNVQDRVNTFHDAHSVRGSQPYSDEYVAILEPVFEHFEDNWLIIDALDELDTDITTQYKLLQHIGGLLDRCNLHLMVTTRPVPSILSHVEHATFTRIAAHGEDLHRFFDSQVSSLARCLQCDTALQEEVKKRLVDAVGEIFLLARLYLDELRHALTPRDIVNVLSIFSEGASDPDVVEKAYSGAVERIQTGTARRKELARRVLSWITFSVRPLKLTELQHAIAVRPGTRFDKDDIVHKDDLVSVCAGLVTIDEEVSTVHLIHYTTYEYLQRDGRLRETLFAYVQAEITEASLWYLSNTSYYPEGDLFKGSTWYSYPPRKWTAYAFLGYAGFHWARHAAKAERPDWEQVFLHLSNDRDNLFTATQLQYRLHEPNEYYQVSATELHLAAEHGLQHLAKRLIDMGMDVNARDERRRTPLFWAIDNHQEPTATMLLSIDHIKTDIEDVSNQTPLTLAIERNMTYIAILLLSRYNVNIHASSSVEPGSCPPHDVQFPLDLAALHGNGSVVQRLLAQVDRRLDWSDARTRTPFRLAMICGHEAIAGLILDCFDLHACRNFADRVFADIYLAALFYHPKILTRLLHEAPAFKHGFWTGTTMCELVTAESSGCEAVQRLYDDPSDKFSLSSFQSEAVDFMKRHKFFVSAPLMSRFHKFRSQARRVRRRR